jgi:hypothetical protein
MCVLSYKLTHIFQQYTQKNKKTEQKKAFFVGPFKKKKI